MENICNDSVFGEMTYRHSWNKKGNISMFGKTWDIIISVKAYSGKPITECEQEAYKDFLKNETDIVNVMTEQLKKYINDNLLDLSEYWPGARSVDQVEELAQMVTPKTLLFKQDGTTIMLFDCVWDIDNGLAIQITPEIAIGLQETFL